jgi:hypothetical protein
VDEIVVTGIGTGGGILGPVFQIYNQAAVLQGGGPIAASSLFSDAIFCTGDLPCGD